MRSVRWKCDGTRAETRFRLSAKRTSPFKSTGGRQFSRILAVEVCASAVLMLDTPCSEVVWRVLATHSIRQFPLHLPTLRHRVPSHFNWTPRLVSNPSYTFCRLKYLRVKIISLALLIEVLGGYSSVGIAASYGPRTVFGSNYRWWRDSLESALGPTKRPAQQEPRIFPMVNRPERGFDHYDRSLISSLPRLFGSASRSYYR